MKTLNLMDNSVIRNLFWSIALCFLGSSVDAQDSTWQRNYSITGYNQLDLRNSSYNGITIHRALHDAYRLGVKPHMSDKLGNVTYGIFSFGATYLTMIWSHEMGHSLRAKQVGGNFKIHNGNLPIPYTTMHLPTDISLPNEALSVTGGFEVNYLTVRKLQREFIEQNGNYNEDLSYGFANRLMYPIYTTLIVPIDPEEKDVWINTAGDPVHCILPVFKEYSKGKVFMADSSVNPDLVKFYNQSAILGTFFNLLDPQLYREVGAAFGNASKSRRPIFLIGDHNTGWTYGTHFNASPLGYELYMHNYLHINGKQFSVYLKYGSPFKNNGIGVRWGNVLNSDRIKLAWNAEVWDQDLFGKGISTEVESSINLDKLFSLDLTAGYKTKGYVLGKQISAGANLGFGLTYHARY